MSDKFTEFDLSTDSYAAFDAVSLRDLIKRRLTEKNIFTDQLFEGSNLSSLVDVIAYSYHTLLFYLNRTSSESIFTEAQLYENVNRIVKLLNYNPAGYKTSVLTFQAKATEVLPTGLYTIPRYSFVDIGGIKYSLASDVAFGKTTGAEQIISSIGEKHLLYQGVFEQFPTQLATGEDFETFTLSFDKSTKIDAYNIHVYIRSNGVWTEYNQTESLFFETPTSNVFEKRLNESKLFEIRFGNDVYGKRLVSGDAVAIYYLKSDQDKGAVGPGALKGQLSPLTTPTFLQIRDNIKSPNVVYMSLGNLQQLTLTNTDPSTKPEQEETVDSIKTLAPKFFGAQHRLITANDFENYVNKQYGNVISNTRVVNNKDYIDGHLSYYVNDLKLQHPNAESRISYNQVNFSSSTNFNNVYIYAVPKFEKITSATPMVNFLSPAQRSLILNGINKIKALTCEPVVIDPVYMAIDIGAALSTETLTPDTRKTSVLNIVKRRDSQRDDDIIRGEVESIIKNYFGTSSSLGYLLNMSSLQAEIASVTDVVDIYMSRTDNTNVKTQGVSFLSWNPVYEQSDISIVTQNTQYPYFKYPYLFEQAKLLDKIKVITSLT